MSIRKIFMIYRKLKRGGEEISIIGMGAASIGLSTEKEAIETIDSALKAGINYFDLAAGHSTVFPYYGKAFENRRKEAYFQIHFGADYTSGEYGWTLDLDKIKHSIDWQLKKLKTDYIDFGFIHCMDEEDDFIRYEKNGVLDYILSLKEKGIDGKMMPVPRDLSSSCGTCVCFDSDSFEVADPRHEIEQVVRVTPTGYACVYRAEDS